MESLAKLKQACETALMVELVTPLNQAFCDEKPQRNVYRFQPVHYKTRTYGGTHSRFRDGWLLAGRVVFAFKMQGNQMQSEEFDPRLSEHRRIWDRKPALRAIYADYHRRLEAACPPGRLLDIGGGSAHFKDYRQDVTSLDILPFPGIDVVADAHDMPFPDGHFAGVVMLDVFHHLQRPLVFLSEAARVLQPGGRLAMIEPGMSAIARHFYKHLHQEPADMNALPFCENQLQSGDDPFDSNQAIPSLVFGTEAARARLAQAVPRLAFVENRWLSLIAYPLSGGFKKWSVISEPLVAPILRLEHRLLPALGPICAFRLMTVLERRTP
jgi:SAM-dependent methyltransferase